MINYNVEPRISKAILKQPLPPPKAAIEFRSPFLGMNLEETAAKVYLYARLFSCEAAACPGLIQVDLLHRSTAPFHF